jgi:hypothetical protein
MVTPRSTLFYSYGPAQASGPDFALGHGQRVTMLSYDYGYSHVAVEGTGQTGYVSTDDLVPAPPLAKPSPSPFPAAYRGRNRHGGEDSRAPTAEEQSRIPLPEFPESMPPPSAPPFRY